MRIPLHIKVHPVVKEFIVSIAGSDTIEPKGDSLFARRIHFVLQLQPMEYSEKHPFRRLKDDSSITILLPRCQMGREKVNVLYRNHLDDRRQYLISRELYAGFKNIFHTYMLAYMKGGGETQKEGIESFCETYNLSMKKINYDMLKKSWDRSQEKQIYNNNSHYSGPLKKIPL